MRHSHVGALLAVLLVLTLVACNNDEETAMGEDEPGSVIGTPQSAAFAALLAEIGDEVDTLGEAADAARERALRVRQAAEAHHSAWEAAMGEHRDEDTKAPDARTRAAMEEANLAETAAVAATGRVIAAEFILQWARKLPPSVEAQARADADGPDSEAAAAVRDDWDVANAATPRIWTAVAEAKAAIADAVVAVSEAEAAVADAEVAVSEAEAATDVADDQNTMD